MECITSPTFSILINGKPNGFFQGKKGLRQGDPLSPYLFIMCMEVLSRLLDAATRNGSFGYHPKCKALGLTHLVFSDDLVIFSDASCLFKALKGYWILSTLGLVSK